MTLPLFKSESIKKRRRRGFSLTVPSLYPSSHSPTPETERSYSRHAGNQPCFLPQPPFTPLLFARFPATLFRPFRGQSDGLGGKLRQSSITPLSPPLSRVAHTVPRFSHILSCSKLYPNRSASPPQNCPPSPSFGLFRFTLSTPPLTSQANINTRHISIRTKPRDHARAPTDIHRRTTPRLHT